jgi:putative FmdB family regulatory protein
MPLYEYACQQCEHTFEALVQSSSDDVECPQCHGAKLERLLSVPAKPRSDAGGLPMRCNSDGPPCGPRCSRF